MNCTSECDDCERVACFYNNGDEDSCEGCIFDNNSGCCNTFCCVANFQIDKKCNENSKWVNVFV